MLREDKGICAAVEVTVGRYEGLYGALQLIHFPDRRGGLGTSYAS